MFSFRTIVKGLTLLALAGCARDSSPPVARVGGQTIRQADLDARLAEAPEEWQNRARTPEGRRQFIDLLIREKLLIQEARRAGLHRQAAYRDAVARYEQEMKRRLEEHRQTLLVESFLRRLRSTDLAVTDRAVQDYYETHRAEFDKPLEIEVRHILTRNAADAEAAAERLRRGDPFEKVAQEVSKDPASAALGGRLAPFGRGALDPAFEQAAFSLRIGEISPPIQTRYGFHIIKKIGEKALPPQRLADVKERLRLRLEREKLDAWMAQKEKERGVRIED